MLNLILLSQFSLDSQASGSGTASHRLDFQGAFRTRSFSTHETAHLASASSSDLPSTSTPSNRRTPNRQTTLDDDSESNPSQKIRKVDSMHSIEDYREIFVDSLSKQTENNQLYHEVLALKKVNAEYSIELSKMELSKKQLELDTARTLAEIEINKQKRLAELEIAKMQEELDN